MSANYPALSGLPVAILTDRPANTRLAVERSRAVATCGVRRWRARSSPQRAYADLRMGRATSIQFAVAKAKLASKCEKTFI
jgi:hypothetical protein